MPPCKATVDFSVNAKRCPTWTCGVHAHRLPEYDSAGTISDANEVGELGEKKSCSCPTTTSVFFQSSRMVAVRRRTSPEFTPLSMYGKPPPTSKFTFPLVLAPINSGPNTSKPKMDCRNVPPKEPDDASPLR